MATTTPRLPHADLPPAIAQLTRDAAKRRARLASDLENADDPLALYERLVRWTTDAFPPEFVHVSGLLEILEEATRHFSKDKDYKGDLRYLRLWSTYATLVDRPATVFKFVMSHGIGLAYAQLYEDYADALEREKR
jgi:checkpoint serine/threonine-protein kinase